MLFELCLLSYVSCPVINIYDGKDGCFTVAGLSLLALLLKEDAGQNRCVFKGMRDLLKLASVIVAQ
jgi:hypothetical protein